MSSESSEIGHCSPRAQTPLCKHTPVCTALYEWCSEGQGRGYHRHRDPVITAPCPAPPAQPITKGVDLEVGEVQILIEIEEAGDKTGQNPRGGGGEGQSILREPAGHGSAAPPNTPSPWQSLTAMDSSTSHPLAFLCEPCSLDITLQPLRWKGAVRHEAGSGGARQIGATR